MMLGRVLCIAKALHLNLARYWRAVAGFERGRLRVSCNLVELGFQNLQTERQSDIASTGSGL